MGRGSFGVVRLVKHKRTKNLYALKCLDKSNIKGKKQIQHVINERDILKRFVKSDFCCNIYESLQDEHNLYMLLDYLPGGELIRQIRKSVFMSEDNFQVLPGRDRIGCRKSAF